MPEEDSRSNALFHAARGDLNSIQMNAELGKVCLKDDDPQARLEQVIDVISRRCLACAEKLTDLEEYVAEIENG